MNTESLRNEVLVPAVAKTLDIAAKQKPQEEIINGENHPAVTVATAICILSGSGIAQTDKKLRKTNTARLSFLYIYLRYSPK